MSAAADKITPELAERWRQNELTVEQVAAIAGCSASTAHARLIALVGRKTSPSAERARASAELRKLVAALYLSGNYSTPQIAAKVGRSREYVRRVLRGTVGRFMSLACAGCGRAIQAAWIRPPAYCPDCAERRLDAPTKRRGLHPPRRKSKA